MNCIILARAEAFASKHPVLPSALDGLGMGLGFTGALCIIAFVRELLGSGTVLGYSVPLYQPAVIFVLPAGAFLTLGMLLALLQWMRQRSAARRRTTVQEGADKHE